MADVQIEHGHVRIANRLLEAILDAEFTGAQVRILLALMRLTFGWRRRTASVTVVELAKYSGLSGTGGFRRAFHDLIRNGVVVEMREGRTITYAIQKDFVHWGEYGGNEGRLAARWDKRPESDDALLKHVEASGVLTLQGHMDDEESPEKIAHGVTLQGHDPIGRDPVGSLSLTPQGHTASPHRVNGEGAKSLFDETVEGGKDRKDRKDSVIQEEASTTTGERLPDADQEIRTFAIGLSTATNGGISARWGVQITPVNYVTGLELAAELVHANIPLELARHAIASVCSASRLDRPPKTIRYFRDAIFAEHRDAEQRVLNAADPGVVARRTGSPIPIGNLVAANADREREQHDRYSAYQAELRSVATAWGGDSANAADYAGIVDRVTASYDDVADSAWKEKGRTADIMRECATRAGFPSFENWQPTWRKVG